MSQKITIVGAGLTGSLLAIYMARHGFNIDVYERRPDMRKVKMSAGKSINLAISARGIHALQQVGLDEEVLKTAGPMKGRQIHPVKGEQSFQPYGKNENEYINSISRRELNVILMNAAEKFPNIRLHFDQKCTGMNLETGEAYFTDELTSKEKTVKGDTVIATDGSASAVRMEFLKSGFFNFSQAYEDYGYKELNIPAAVGGGFRMEKNALHIWPRGAYMMIALPNIDGDFTCTLFMAHDKGEVNLNQLTTREAVNDFFKEVMPDALPNMPTLLDDFFNHPTGNLLTIKCFPWNINGKALLMGDAAHAIVPFFGQGMNCGFEDCYYFDTLIKKYGSDWKKVFTEFSAMRKENTDAIADLAVENFVEMRDLVAHKDFLLKKKADVLLEERFPESFISKYAMVSFHRIPYAVAMKRGQIQDRVLMEMCAKINAIEELDLAEAFLRIKKEFEKAGIPEKIVLSEKTV
jgi:kynurenine 3-monooxygenase